MRKIALVILVSLLATPTWATTYYLATAAGGGSDSNNGTSASTPWLTPNHSLNCGDVILAAASTAYAPANFSYNKWGMVTCAAGNNVSWLKCVTFDACKMRITSTDGFHVDNNYWGVQGFEVDGSTSSARACFMAFPDNGNIHHIIFANNIANGCGLNGYSLSVNGAYGVDYFAVVGNIAYNSARGSEYRGSGISVFEPVQSDTLQDTHLYIAGNFSYDNVDGNPCDGNPPSDGEGVIFDNLLVSYSGQAVADNNILVFNGGRGLDVLLSANPLVYFRHNTVYGNNTADNVYACSEILVDQSSKVEAFENLAMAATTDACSRYTLYAYQVNMVGPTVNLYDNFGYSAVGNNLGQTGTDTGFSASQNNTFGTNPNFVNPVDPGAPSCGSASSVPNCMATVIANFTPTTAAAVGYGYQIPSTAQTYDPLFPHWLCSVTNLPAGLVTMGCLPAPATNLTLTIQ